MRIGINAVPLHYVTGGARHVLMALLRELLGGENPHHYVIFCHPSARALLGDVLALGGDRVQLICAIDEEQVYPHRDRFDLYFSPLNSQRPRIFDRPTVAILHDIQEQYFPRYFSHADLMARYETYPEICRSATIVVAVSEFCKRCFIEKFGVDPRKIEVMPIAAQMGLVATDSINDGEWPGEPLPSSFVLYPANTYPHKNHALLLDAVEKLSGHGAIGAVFTGDQVAGGYPLAEQIKKRGLSDACRVFTDLSVARMRFLYRHALAVVMPTMFEGFGMPALEALACGCPLVCSDIPPLREIAGEHALYFQPGDLEGLCERLDTIAGDEILRSRLIAGGLEAAQKFSWESTGRKLLEIFAAAERRFKYGLAEEPALPRPRLGILVREVQGGEPLRRTLKSIADCGYAQCAIAILGPDGRLRPADAESAGRDRPQNGADAEAPRLAASLARRSRGADSRDASLAENASQARPLNGGRSSGADSAALLIDFAAQSQLDLVGELIEGNCLRPSALDSLAISFGGDPQRTVHLGEAAVWRGERYAGVANLRLTGDRMWKMNGMLYSEMMFLAPAAFSKWSAGQAVGEVPSALWRWKLLFAARRDDQLAIVRRTFADCQRASWTQKLRAYRAGMLDFHRMDNQPVRVSLLRRFEQPVRMLSATLPLSMQRIGTRFWYRLMR